MGTPCPHPGLSPPKAPMLGARRVGVSVLWDAKKGNTMAVAVAAVAGASRVEGNKRVRVLTLTFSSNYATGGEALTPAACGLKKIDFVRFSGVAVAADLATAVPVSFDYANNKVVMYEGSSAGTALSEKTNAEAYPTGCVVRAEVVGY